MKNIKLGIALLTVAVFTSAQANNHRTPGEVVTAAPAVVLNGAVDILSFGHTKQLQEYSDRSQQDPANVSPTFGEAILAPATVVIDAPFGQTGKESYVKKTDSQKHTKSSSTRTRNQKTEDAAK